MTINKIKGTLRKCLCLPGLQEGEKLIRKLVVIPEYTTITTVIAKTEGYDRVLQKKKQRLRTSRAPT